MPCCAGLGDLSGEVLHLPSASSQQGAVGIPCLTRFCKAIGHHTCAPHPPVRLVGLDLRIRRMGNKRRGCVPGGLVGWLVGWSVSIPHPSPWLGPNAHGKGPRRNNQAPDGKTHRHGCAAPSPRVVGPAAPSSSMTNAAACVCVRACMCMRTLVVCPCTVFLGQMHVYLGARELTLNTQGVWGGLSR